MVFFLLSVSILKSCWGSINVCAYRVQSQTPLGALHNTIHHLSKIQ